jgi:predicted AAA+ superfamily ATPase
LFETWVVTEALKWRAVRGDKQPVYFWRDNIGNEIDLLLEQDGGLTLVEVKSGQTFQSEWLRNLHTVQRHLGEPVRGALVYGGNLPQTRDDITVLPWQDLAFAL